MSQELEEQLSVLKSETLTPIIRKALKHEAALPIEWSFKRLPGGDANPITAGIYRFSGKAMIRNEEVPWSLILKVVNWVDFTGTPLEKNYINEPADWNYWRREALAYRSGILDQVQGNLVSIKALEITEPTATTVWIWQEEVLEPNRSEWKLDRHVLAAQHFGEFAGAYVGYSPSPQHDPWFCRHFIRQWTRGIAGFGLNDLTHDSAFWDNADVKLALPAVTTKRLESLLEDAEYLCDILEKQPQTLSHQDTHWTNLFATHDLNDSETTTVIDWSFIGLAAVGEDLGTQIAGNLSYYHVNPLKAKTYHEAALRAYMTGLQKSGWHGDENSVRFACNTTAALRYATFEMLMLKWALDDKSNGKPSWIEEMAQKQNMDRDEALINWGKGITFLFDLADEARSLVKQL